MEPTLFMHDYLDDFRTILIVRELISLEKRRMEKQGNDHCRPPHSVWPRGQTLASFSLKQAPRETRQCNEARSNNVPYSLWRSTLMSLR